MTKSFLMGNQAFAHAALEAGVRVCAGYPGTPSSEVIETVAKLRDAGSAHDVYVEWSTNEKAALEMLAGAALCGARTLFTAKQVGLNVASDPLMSLNYIGVEGGTVLLVPTTPARSLRKPNRIRVDLPLLRRFPYSIQQRPSKAVR